MKLRMWTTMLLLGGLAAAPATIDSVPARAEPFFKDPNSARGREPTSSAHHPAADHRRLQLVSSGLEAAMNSSLTSGLEAALNSSLILPTMPIYDYIIRSNMSLAQVELIQPAGSSFSIWLTFGLALTTKVVISTVQKWPEILMSQIDNAEEAAKGAVKRKLGSTRWQVLSKLYDLWFLLLAVVAYFGAQAQMWNQYSAQQSQIDEDKRFWVWSYLYVTASTGKQFDAEIILMQLTFLSTMERDEEEKLEGIEDMPFFDCLNKLVDYTARGLWGSFLAYTLIPMCVALPAFATVHLPIFLCTFMLPATCAIAYKMFLFFCSNCKEMDGEEVFDQETVGILFGAAIQQISFSTYWYTDGAIDNWGTVFGNFWDSFSVSLCLDINPDGGWCLPGFPDLVLEVPQFDIDDIFRYRTISLVAIPVFFLLKPVYKFLVCECCQRNDRVRP